MPATLADTLTTPDVDAVIEGAIAITPTEQRAAGVKTLAQITYSIEVANSTYLKADVPAGDYDVLEYLESDGMRATEPAYRVHVPDEGTWSLRALKELWVGAPPDPSAVEVLIAALATTYVRSVNGETVDENGNVVIATAEVPDEVITEAVDTNLAGRDLIEGDDARIPEVMTTEDDWLHVVTDADDKVLYGVRPDGLFVDFREGIPEVITWNSEEWAYVITDADDKIIAGWRTDGTVYPEPVGTDPYVPPIPITSVWPAVGRGDSTTATTNVTAGQGWIPKLAVLTGQTIDNYGSSGQRAEEIAAQMGGITFTATVTGNSIPASGAVALTNLELNPVRGGEISSYTVKINGIVGVLARGASDTTVNFTRSTAGSVTAVPAIVDVESVSGPALNHRIHFIAFGVNNEPLITAGSPTQRVEDIMGWYKACTSVLTPARPRFVVWGMLDRGASEGVGTTVGILIRKVEDYLGQQYGSDFLPIRRLLASYRALAIAGVSPTSTDDADIAAGAVPDSLRDAGSVHLNATGMTVQAHFMHQHLLRKGWI
jgi:hypothetical protein